ncbi:MAG: hypothetical protein K1X70_09640 [Leptospirales bacterium]|nr:hypothetical protein [Leptospirales bacterium]
MKIRIAGRYFREPLTALIRGIHRAGVVARRRTVSERVSAYVGYSLQNDFREGFRPRIHGFDSHSIASRFHAGIDRAIERERAEQERQYLKDAILACEDFVRAAEGRLLELGGQGGSVVYFERQRQIREGRDRIEERARRA